MSKRLGKEYKNRSMSHGTHKHDDIFNSVKSLLSPQLVAEYKGLKTDAQRMGFLFDTVFEYLDSIGPIGYYFGAHPGDGSDFGFWKIED